MSQRIIDMNGSGYGDRDLLYVCHKCGGEVNHDFLRVAKFKKDTESLILKDWPLGGTILNPKNGFPDAPTEQNLLHHPDTFPNRLVGIELRAPILELIQPNSTNKPTMNHIKGFIESAIKKRSAIKKVNNKSVFHSGTLLRQECLGIRKMMSRYWGNTSIFALELGGAVIRQGTFIDKMKSIDWLHSPAATSTMTRLLTKYTRFIGIIAANSLHTVVPTLDVDLAWHTHQLSPKSYYRYTVEMCKKFIDHDDKIDEDALSTSFEWTSKTYEKSYNEVYSECTCWYCEAIRTRHVSTGGRIFGKSKHEKLTNAFYDSGAAKLCPPDKSAHISSHNAVQTNEDATLRSVRWRLRAMRKTQLEDAHIKACKRAKTKGRPVPTKDEYYYGAWGYPYMMYGPYMAFPMYGGIYYAGDPCTMVTGTGMAGACAVGTCGGGVGAGACSGPGGCGMLFPI
jgi:hypothetical protein